MENNCVTVIIPVYNTDEKFMNKCIESFATQTYKDIEILIVDDGSNKSTFEILEEYRKKYKNITVYHKKMKVYQEQEIMLWIELKENGLFLWIQMTTYLKMR